MLTLGMHEQVIALADKAIDRIVDAPVGEAPFTDIDRQIWLMNNRSIAYERVGKPMEALAELKRARGFDESGAINVSQALNLGMFYCGLQQPRDALAEIALVGDMSGYGRMVEANVQLWAALELGKREDADAALDYLRQHRDDAPVLLLEGLLRDGRMDEAAALVKTLLADGYRRGDLLDWMQGWRRAKALPGEVVAQKNRDALLARPDVVAALEPVGRIAPVALYTTYD
jgi:tetratricopeptide (TPR) repeat protein